MDPPSSIAGVDIVDPDLTVFEGVLRALPGIHCVHYPSVAQWRESHAAADAQALRCVITEAVLPDGSCLDVLTGMQRAGLGYPVIVLAESIDIPRVVEVMRFGAVDVLMKMPTPAELMNSMRRAAERWNQRRLHFAAPSRPTGTFTAREQEVLDLVMKGHSSSQIAQQLGISRRTVELHRSRIMLKAGARNVAELVARIMKDTRTKPGQADS